MKASYTKPLLAVEAFSLAQTTARDCADNLMMGAVKSGDPYACVWDLGSNQWVFMLEGNCNIDGLYFNEIYCYNAPAEGSYIFRS